MSDHRRPYQSDRGESHREYLSHPHSDQHNRPSGYPGAPPPIYPPPPSLPMGSAPMYPPRGPPPPHMPPPPTYGYSAPAAPPAHMNAPMPGMHASHAPHYPPPPPTHPFPPPHHRPHQRYDNYPRDNHPRDNHHRRSYGHGPRHERGPPHRDRGRPQKPSTPAMKDFALSDIQHLFNPAQAQEHKQLPLPPMPQPLPFAPDADARYGPDWEGGYENAYRRFNDMWLPCQRQLKRLFHEVERAVDEQLRERTAELERASNERLAQLERDWQAADEAEAAEAAAKKNEFLEEGAEAATAESMLADVRAKHAAEREAQRADERRNTADAIRQVHLQRETLQGERAREEGLSLVREMVAKGVWESAVAYALIRLGRHQPTAPLLSAFLDGTGRAGALINSPIPTDETWLVHRSAWDANPAVVRVLTTRGAITHRLSRYNEHPALTVHAARYQDPSKPRCTEQQYNEVISILAETMMRGASAAPAAAPSSTTLAPVETGNPQWLQQLPRVAATGQRHVYVMGVPFEYPMESLEEWFSSCGKIVRMHANTPGDAFLELRTEKLGANDAKHGGACVIVFATAEAAAKALAYDGYPLLTRRIHVTAHKPTDAEKQRWRAENAATSDASHAQDSASVSTGAGVKSKPESAKAHAVAQAMKAEQRRLQREKQRERAATKELKRRDKLAKEAELKREKRAERERAAQAAELAQLAHGADGPDGMADAADAAPAPTAQTSTADASAGVTQPSWVSHLPAAGPTQTHVFVLDLPFEAAPAAVTEWAMAFPGAVDVYVPTRALKESSAHDQRLAAALSATRGAAVTVVHKSWCVVQCSDPASVRACVRERDGAMLMGVPVRVLRARANKSLTVAQNKEREAAMEAKEREAAEALPFTSTLPMHSYAAPVVAVPGAATGSGASKRKEREVAEVDVLAAASSHSYLSKLSENSSVADAYLSRRKRAKVRAEEVVAKEDGGEDEEFVL